MSATVGFAFVEDFESLVYHLGQQEMSRLRNSVRNRTGTGNIYNYERLASANMAASAGRNQATPVVNVEHSRRRCAVTTWEWGEIVDQEDLVRILIDPESEYLLSAGAAMGRQVDQLVAYAAVDNTTTAGADSGAPGTSVGELGAGQFVGAAGGKLTLDDLRAAKRLLDQAEVGIMQGGDRYAVINAKGLQDLLEVTEVASADYNSVKALVQGDIDTFMGFKFIRTEILPGNTQNSNIGASNVGCLFYERSALGLSISDDRFTRVGEDPGRKFATRIFCQLTMGVARIEDEGVVVASIAAT